MDVTRGIATLSLLAIFAFIAAPATAQDKSIEQLNEEGIKAFQEGRFAEAADRFHKAYELQPAATLKKNEAIAWFKAGQCDKAVPAADAFLMEAPEDPTSVKEARSVVAKCKVQFAETAVENDNLDKAEKLLSEAETLEPEEAVVADIEKARANVAQRREALAKAEAERKRRAAEERRQAEASTGMNQALGWGLTGGGGAIVLGTFIYHMVVLFSVHPEYEDVGKAGVDRARFDELGSQLDTAQWLVPTLYAVGLASTGVGVYFLMSDTGSESAPPQEGSALAPAGKSWVIGVQGRF